MVLRPGPVALQATPQDHTRPLHLSASKNYAECVALLLAAGADTTVLDGHRLSALSIARQRQNYAVIALLTAGEEGRRAQVEAAISKVNAETRRLHRLNLRARCQLMRTSPRKLYWSSTPPRRITARGAREVRL